MSKNRNYQCLVHAVSSPGQFITYSIKEKRALNKTNGVIYFTYYHRTIWYTLQLTSKPSLKTIGYQKMPIFLSIACEGVLGNMRFY